MAKKGSGAGRRSGGAKQGASSTQSQQAQSQSQQTQANAAGTVGGGNAAPPPGVWGSNIAHDVAVRMLPNWDANLPLTDVGIDAYFIRNGIDAQSLAQLKADPNGLAKAVGLVNQQASPQPSNTQGASTATDATTTAPRKPRTPGNVSKLFEGTARGATAGGAPGGGVKKVTYSEGADGSVKAEMVFRKALEDAAAAAGGAPTPQPGGPTPTPTPPAPTPLPTFEEAVEARAQRYRDRGKVPPPWNSTMTMLERNSPTIVGGALGLGALGAVGGGIAVGNYMLSDKEPKNAGGVPPNVLQPPVNQDRVRQLEMQRLERLGIPMQSPNPAGMPPADNSTLLMRVMNSRSV